MTVPSLSTGHLFAGPERELSKVHATAFMAREGSALQDVFHCSAYRRVEFFTALAIVTWKAPEQAGADEA